MDARHINNREQYLHELEAELSKIQLEYQRLCLENKQRKDSTNNRQEIEKDLVSHTFFYRTFYNNPVPMCIATFESATLLDVNQSFANVLGYQREEMIGKNIVQLGIWADPDEIRATHEKLDQYGTIQDAEYRFKCKTGEIGYAIVSFHLTRINNEEYLLVSFVDITRRKKAELDLINANQKFSKVFYGNQTAISISRLSDGLVIDVNQAYLVTMGFERDEIIGKPIDIWIQTEDRQKIVGELLEKGYIRNNEYSISKRNGEIRHIIASIAQLEIDSEICILISFQDISERKKAEEALRIANEKFSKAFHNSKAIMSIARLIDGVCVDVNNTWATTLGYRREEMIGKTATELNFWADPAERQTMYEQLNKEGYLINFESKYRKRSGDIGYTLSSINIINMNGEDHIMVTAIDTTEIKKYENEIKRLDSLNLMGQMAGSIAHEVRNPMTSIKGYLQLFHEENRYADDREAIELMIEELDRVNDIITTFLSLSQKNHIEMKLLHLKDCINGMLQLIIADALKNDVFIDTIFEPIPKTLMDKGEVKQLFLNLAKNAIEAMPSGGILTIRTFEDTNGVNLVVQDKGKGLPLEIMEKIGTPFLTTKEHGSGLGLAVCYTIAERHNAKITVETSSEGTSFKVTFPVVA